MSESLHDELVASAKKIQEFWAKGRKFPSSEELLTLLPEEIRTAFEKCTQVMKVKGALAYLAVSLQFFERPEEVCAIVLRSGEGTSDKLPARLLEAFYHSSRRLAEKYGGTSKGKRLSADVAENYFGARKLNRPAAHGVSYHQRSKSAHKGG